MKKLIPLILIAFVVSSCVSSKKHFQKGQYDMAVKKAVKKLRKKPTKEKEILILEKAYNKANDRDNERVNFLKLEGSPDMWDEVYTKYSKMKNRQSLVKSVVPLEIMSTGRIVNFTFVNYDEEIINAKKKAAEYFYSHAQTLLKKKGRDNAKKAYFEFLRVKELYANYKDVDEQIKKAKFLATLKVIAEPIPMHSRTFGLSNEFFDNKINEFLGNMPSSEFVRFYTVKEAQAVGLEYPDHILKLKFDDFVVGQTYLKEKEIQVSKDNVVLAIKDKDGKTRTGDDKISICHVTAGKPSKTITVAVSAWTAHSKHGDHLGACNSNENDQMEIISGTVKATVNLFTKTITSKGLLDFQIYDPNADKVLTQEKFPGSFVWICQWGYFNGDERALNNEQKKSMKSKELHPPPPQDLFLEFTKPIYDQLTSKIKNFYRNY